MPARGTGQFGPDIIVGSAEYQKLMRQKNPKTHKAAQAKYRLKQKQLIHAQKLAVADGISVDEALAEITARTDAIVLIRREDVASGRIDHVATDPIEVEVEAPIPEIVKEAKERNVPYAVVKAEWEAQSAWTQLEKLVEEKENDNKDTNATREDSIEVSTVSLSRGREDSGEES
jgi:hypothetical protein